jgi:prepilin-type N-terminal cleavage/methylation domain-containing protein
LRWAKEGVKPSFEPRNGFTLIELMLVLAIASLLLAIVAPSWRHVQTDPAINGAGIYELSLKEQ